MYQFFKLEIYKFQDNLFFPAEELILYVVDSMN